MAKIVDPDQLDLNTEVVINTGAKSIQLLEAGQLNNDSPGQDSGVTLQAVYSFLKDRWMDTAALNKFRFPMKAIYEAKFLMENSWIWADQLTRDLIRDAGWREYNGNEYATIISLGTMDDDLTDQAYYQNIVGLDSTGIFVFDKTGRLNEPILIYDGVNDYRDYLKVFIREQGKTFDQYNLLVSQGLPVLTYIAYRLPLGNAVDIKIEYTDNNIETLQPFISMSLQYYTGTRFEAWDVGETYVIGDVVQSALDRWYRATTGNTADEPPSANWETYPGEKQIGTDYYAFNREIRCAGVNQADAEELYAYAQYRLREAININDDPDLELYGEVIGRIANPLCYFVGNTLHSSPGVWIENFDPNITNDIVMWVINAAVAGTGGLDLEDLPKSSTGVNFPFVSAGNMVFNTDLVNDPDSKYWMYFANAGGNLFDTANAIIVNDNDGNPITGAISTSIIPFTFDYTYNNQGGRVPPSTAVVYIVAMGLTLAEWVVAEFSITNATGLTFPVNASTERNYIE